MVSVPWRVIHVAKDPEAARKVQTILESEGFAAYVHPLKSDAAQSGFCEIRVSRAEAEEALMLLMEKQ